MQAGEALQQEAESPTIRPGHRNQPRVIAMACPSCAARRDALRRIMARVLARPVAKPDAVRKGAAPMVRLEVKR